LINGFWFSSVETPGAGGALLPGPQVAGLTEKEGIGEVSADLLN
jgi:hypothetical protein